MFYHVEAMQTQNTFTGQAFIPCVHVALSVNGTISPVLQQRRHPLQSLAFPLSLHAVFYINTQSKSSEPCLSSLEKFS